MSVNVGEKIRCVRNMFLAVRVGDELGMSVESMSRQKILEALGPQGVTKYLHPVQARVHDTANFKAGNGTDDWQLTRCNIGSFTKNRDYDPRSFAIDHIFELKRSVAGWGNTTSEGLTQLQEYFESYGVKGRHYLVPAVCGENRGAGNGVAMQIAPFAAFYNLRQGGFQREPLMTSVLSLGQMTHSHPDALIAPYLLAAAMSLLLDGLGDGNFFKTLLEEHTYMVDRMHYVHNNNVGQKLQKLAIAALVHGYNDGLYRSYWPASEFGTGVLASESVMYSLAKAVQNLQNFEKGVLEAVNDGGDTDSTASMVGALIAANGADIPQWMLDYPNQTETDNPRVIENLAAEFCAVALNG